MLSQVVQRIVLSCASISPAGNASGLARNKTSVRGEKSWYNTGGSTNLRKPNAGIVFLNFPTSPTKICVLILREYGIYESLCSTWQLVPCGVFSSLFSGPAITQAY